MSVRIASSNLNQTPLDWRGNLNNIRESIKIAKDNSVDILCLPRPLNFEEFESWNT